MLKEFAISFESLPFKISDYLFDLSPHTWLRKYRKNSILWILVMAFFYHLLSVGMMYVGSTLVIRIIPEYEAPSFPVSLSLAIISGPLEEGLFFGIPYYVGGTAYSVLVGGTIWSIAHIFGTQTLTPNSLAYANFAATIPHIFFSLRTWVSGRGWFAILFHSAWNAAFVLSYCGTGILSCAIFDSGDQMITEILAVISACSVISIVYILHRKTRISAARFRVIMILSASVFVTTQLIMAAKYVQPLLS